MTDTPITPAQTDTLAKLMSEARKQGQQDVLGASPITTQAATDVLAERRRQVEDEGWTPEHDDAHGNGEMAFAAAAYTLHAAATLRPYTVPGVWPWDRSWWKPSEGNRRRDLVKAGALILAEIERLDRAALATGGARHG